MSLRYSCTASFSFILIPPMKLPKMYVTSQVGNVFHNKVSMYITAILTGILKS